MNINNGNNNLGFNKKTSDKKVLKKIEELEEKINDIEVGDIDLKDYAKAEDIPTKTSELVNDSNYIDREYVDYAIDGVEKIAFSDVEPTDGDINIWINTAEDIKDEWNIIQINDKTTSSSSAWSSEKTSNQINNKISQLKAENDKKYVTETYVKEQIEKAELEGVDIDLSDYAKKTDLHTHNNKLVLDSVTSKKINEWNNKSDFSGDYNDLTNKPNVHIHNNKSTLDNITSEKINEWDNKSDFSGDYNDLTNKPNVENLVSKENMEEYVDNAIENVEINGMYLHTHNNKSALDDITSEKINEWDNKSDFSGNYNDLANKPNVPTKISQLTNDSNFINSIPSEYVTESELNRKGYLTQHQDISGKADKTELHSHNNKSALDTITATRITVWNNKSDFSGNYNDLTNKPTIPVIDGLATEGYVNDLLKSLKLVKIGNTIKLMLGEIELSNISLDDTLEK